LMHGLLEASCNQWCASWSSKCNYKLAA
jgi:hypothetical protein